MYNTAAIQQITTARHIARSARQQIKNKTGIGVNMVFYPTTVGQKTPENMMAIVAGSLGMGYDCFKLRSRERNVVELRFLAALFLRRNFPLLTLQQIAGLFGGLDHSSVVSGLTRAHNLIFTNDQRFIKKYNTVLNTVDLWLRKEELESA